MGVALRKVLNFLGWGITVVLSLAPTPSASKFPSMAEFLGEASAEAILDRAVQLESLGLFDPSIVLLQAEVTAGNEGARRPLLAALTRSGEVTRARSLLQAWGGPEKVGGDDIYFGRAVILAALEENEAAAEAFLESARREPLLSDYAKWRAARLLDQLDRNEEALHLFEDAATSARNQDLAARASWRAAQMARGVGDASRALANLERIPPKSPIARRDLLELEVGARRAAGDVEGEKAALREAIRAVPSSDFASTCVVRLRALVTPTIEDRLAFADVGLSGRNPTLAEAEARSALESLKQAPDPGSEGKARLLLGRALAARNKLTAARDELSLLPAGAAPSDLALAALEKARCLWKLNLLDAALQEYDALVASDAPPETRARALWEAAREAKDAKRWDDAVRRLRDFQSRFPDEKEADDALWHVVRGETERGNLEAARLADSLLATRYPDSSLRDESAYWLATAFLRSERTEEACQTIRQLFVNHPDGYWTIRARERFEGALCGELPKSSDSARDSLQTNDALRARGTIVGTEAFRRAEALARWGSIDEAESEIGILRRLLHDDSTSLFVLAQQSSLLGITRGGMQAVSTLRSRVPGSILSGTFPRDAARLLYPVAHLDEVLRWCSEYGVDPFFVFAVMREESWFDAEAVSPAGARGLLQIMPATGHDLARQTGLAQFEREDLFNPAINIRLGVYYLHRLFTRNNNEPILALAAYNAGERNARRWKSEVGGKLDVDRTVFGITFRETSDYVQRVSTTHEIYRTLWGEFLPQWRELQSQGTPASETPAK